MSENTAEEIQPKIHRQIRGTIHDARMGNITLEDSHNFICDLMQEHTAQTLDRLKEGVEKLYSEDDPEDYKNAIFYVLGTIAKMDKIEEDIMSDQWQKEAENAIKKIHNAAERGTGTNLTAEEVQALMLTGIGEDNYEL